MIKNYRQLAENVQFRLNPDNLSFEKSLNEELSSISYSDILTYIRLAMNAVQPEYTAKSKEAGERVKNHLRKELDDVSFRYQGSVMTDTHIKGVSDIDLLVISEKSYRWNSAEVTGVLTDFSKRNNYNQSQIQKLEFERSIASGYEGDSLQDLKTIRVKSEIVLGKIYSQCDNTKPKAIKIKNLDLNREVDSVTANWYDSAFSIANGKGDNGGIQVYNKDTHSRGGVGYPFLSIYRINTRSAQTSGRLKKMIRFLKHIKSDSSYNIKLSSFDLNAICYDIEVSKYQNLSFYELVGIIYNQLNSIISNNLHSDKLKSVDNTEYIFRGSPEKIENLRLILAEVEGVFLDLVKNKTVIL